MFKSHPCPYCGNNPVPHRFFWYNETLNILLTPIRQKILYNPLTRFFKQRQWGGKMALFFLRLGERLKIIRRQTDIVKCKVRRAQVLWEEAGRRGIEMAELLFFGWPIDCYAATKGTGSRVQGTEIVASTLNPQPSTLIFSGLPRPAGYVNNWLDLMDDKWLFKKKLADNGLPAPRGAAVTGLRQALEIFNKISKPIIVKPRAGSRGRHSATFVSSAEDLKQAFKIAKQLCYWVMVEEQLFGPVYRATVVNFKLEGVLRGDPPQVIGDGVHSIMELISAKNSQARPGVKNIAVDDSASRFLSRQSLKLASVVPGGTAVNLSEKIGVNYGGSSAEDFDICHPKTRELFVKAAKVLGDPIVGFDFIIADIAKPWQEQKCGFIEVNSLPFINLHHDPLLGHPRNVAAKVWDMMGF